MAVKTAQKIRTTFRYDAPLYKWSALTAGDTAEPMVHPRMSDKSVMVLGDFGAGGSIELEGTLDPDGTTYVTLRDILDAAIQVTADDIVMVQQNVWKLRPKVVGAVVAVDVFVLGR